MGTLGFGITTPEPSGELNLWSIHGRTTQEAWKALSISRFQDQIQYLYAPSFTSEQVNVDSWMKKFFVKSQTPFKLCIQIWGPSCEWEGW